MKSIKKVAAVVLSATLLIIGTAGCQQETDSHEHTFDTEWTSDPTSHWHAATCEHTAEVSGKAAHTFGEWASDENATTEADGTKSRTCSVCGYKDTVPEEGTKIHAHTFGEWALDSDYAWDNEIKSRTCSVCGYKETERFHTFAKAWSKDETDHWHAAACGDTDQTSEKANHSFGSLETTNPTLYEDGKKKYTCTVCRYEKVIEVFPKTGIKISYKKFLDKLIECGEIIEITANETAEPGFTWNAEEKILNIYGVNITGYSQCGYFKMYWDENDEAIEYEYLDKIKKIDASGIGFSEADLKWHIFYYCEGAEELKYSQKIKVSTFDNIQQIYNYCKSVKSVDLTWLDFSDADEDSIIFDYLFRYCNSLREIDLTSFDWSKIIYISLSSVFKDLGTETEPCVIKVKKGNWPYGSDKNLFGGKNLQFIEVE